MSTARKTKQTRQSSHPSAFWNCWGILVTCGGNEIKQIRQEEKLFICRAFQMLNRVRNSKNCSRLMERLRCNIQWTSKGLVDRQTNEMIRWKTPWREIECYFNPSLLGAPYIDEAHGMVFKATNKKIQCSTFRKKCWGQLAFKLFGRQKNCTHRKTPWREIECYFNPSFLGTPYIDEAHGMVFKATKKKIQCSTFRKKCCGQLAFKSLVARKSILVAKNYI